MRFTFDADASEICAPTIEEATEAAPDFAPYTGAAVTTCTPAGSVLTCTFIPSLENLRTYGFTFADILNGSVKIRGLIGDVDGSGIVDAVDRALVVGAWTGSGFSCPTDLNNNGITDAVDRAIVVGAWTNPVNRSPCPNFVMDGEGGGESMMGPMESDGAESAPPNSDGTYVESEIVIEVQPLGVGEALTTLAAGQTYELHYAGALYPAQGYTLFVHGPQGQMVTAAAASRGTWSATGLLDAAALVGDVPAACGGPESADACYRIMDDLADAQSTDPAGYLCIISPAAAESLAVEVVLYSTDETASATYVMLGSLSISVAP